MVSPFARRTCPYCGKRSLLGRYPVVATNYEYSPSEDATTGPTVPVSGARVHGHLDTEHGPLPVLARPPLELRRNHLWRDLLRTLMGCWRLPPVTRRADPRDLPARLCLSCRHRLPVDIDDRRIVTIAVLGTKSAGKTHYLASAMYQASRMQGLRAVGCEQFEPDERTAKDYHEKYYEPLFVEKQRIKSTDYDEKVQFSPLVYRVRFHGAAPCSLLFHDVSGEMLDLPENRVRYAQFIYRADAAIFLVDPDYLGIPGGQRHGGEQPRARSYNQADLFIGWLNDLQRRIPIAVTVSKSDQVSAAFPGSYDRFLEDPPADGAGWSRQMREISDLVQGLLRQVRAHDLLAAAQRRRPEASFHAVSALGYRPRSDGGIDQLEPRRCLDPLVTVLSRVPAVTGAEG